MKLKRIEEKEEKIIRLGGSVLRVEGMKDNLKRSEKIVLENKDETYSLFDRYKRKEIRHDRKKER